jgi:hypothetical protein
MAQPLFSSVIHIKSSEFKKICMCIILTSHVENSKHMKLEKLAFSPHMDTVAS